MEAIHTARLFGILYRQSHAYIAAACADIGIGGAECIFLMNLYECEGCNQEALSTIICVDKAVTARAIKSLEEKGFLVRVRDAKDQREKHIYLTERARSYRALLSGRIQKWVDYIMQDLDGAARAVVMDGLDSLSRRAVDLPAPPGDGERGPA